MDSECACMKVVQGDGRGLSSSLGTRIDSRLAQDVADGPGGEHKSNLPQFTHDAAIADRCARIVRLADGRAIDGSGVVAPETHSRSVT